jgi:hypothetical protein
MLTEKINQNNRPYTVGVKLQYHFQKSRVDSVGAFQYYKQLYNDYTSLYAILIKEVNTKIILVTCSAFLLKA